MFGKGTNSWAVFKCFPRYNNRELDWKWSGQDSPYGMPAFQAESQLEVPWHYLHLVTQSVQIQMSAWRKPCKYSSKQHCQCKSRLCCIVPWGNSGNRNVWGACQEKMCLKLKRGQDLMQKILCLLLPYQACCRWWFTWISSGESYGIIYHERQTSSRFTIRFWTLSLKSIS